MNLLTLSFFLSSHRTFRLEDVELDQDVVLSESAVPRIVNEEHVGFE